MYNFFFSYSRNVNKEITEEYISSLESYGFKLWYDKVDVILGKNIYDELHKVLSMCKQWNGMILFIDNTYFNKKWCLQELTFALEHNITLYPILINITKNDIPADFEILKDINLCTIKTKQDIQYAINKTLFLYINSICPLYEKPKVISNHSTLNHLILDFKNSNQQNSSILFTCDNIALCLKCIFNERKMILSDDFKLLFNIIHLTTQKHYIDEKITRFHIRIVVEATNSLLNIYE